MFEDLEIRLLAGRASSIHERLNGSYVPIDSQASSKAAAKRFQTWRLLAADGDEGLFGHRLRAENLSEEAVLPLLGDVVLEEGQPLPNWLAAFQWSMEALANGPEATAAETQNPVPFEEILQPLVNSALSRIRAAGGFSEEIYAESVVVSTGRGLLRKVSELLAPALYEEFFAFRSAYKQVRSENIRYDNYSPQITIYKNFVKLFRSKMVRDFFYRRPVLARLLSTTLIQWHDAGIEAHQRLSSDLPSIRHIFGNTGKIIEIIEGQSDQHNLGRSVFIYEFADKSKIVYKPKNLNIHDTWSHFINQMDAWGSPLSSRDVKILAKDRYGWMEWVSPATCHNAIEVDVFFRRAGALLCAFHVLQGTDMHFENLIASGSHPIPLDLETLLQPWLRGVPETGPVGAISAAAIRLRDSVLATGFLPHWVMGPAGEVAGIGALNPIVLSGPKRWQFSNVNTDEMSYGEEVLDNLVGDAFPTLEGRQVQITSYSRALLEGFTAMYHLLAKTDLMLGAGQEPIIFFKNCSVRVVLQNTMLYSLLLKRAQETKNLYSGVDWSINFEFLARLLDWEREPAVSSEIFKHERENLCRGDIPLFAARAKTKDLWLSESDKLINFFSKSGYEQVRDRLLSMSEERLKVQLSIISQALGASTGTPEGPTEDWPESESDVGHDVPIERWTYPVARGFAELLQEQAILSGGGACWLGLRSLTIDKWQFGLAGCDLYSGAAGIGLFLSAVAKTTDDGEFGELALKAIAPYLDILDGSKTARKLIKAIGVGAGTGITSLIYALVRMAALQENDDLLRQACEIARKITDEDVYNKSSLDILSGSAGAIMALLSLYRASGDHTAIERAVQFGERLVERIDKGTGAWSADGSKPLTGFAHGAAGIAAALLRLFGETQSSSFLDAAIDGIRYERDVYSSEAQNWPDFRGAAECPRFVTRVAGAVVRRASEWLDWERWKSTTTMKRQTRLSAQLQQHSIIRQNP